MHLPVPDRLIEHPLDLLDTPRAAEHPDHPRIGPEPNQKRQVDRRDRVNRQPSRRETPRHSLLASQLG
jgi:hypothetical protein